MYYITYNTKMTLLSVDAGENKNRHGRYKGEGNIKSNLKNY